MQKVVDMLDVGLLGCMSGLKGRTLIDGNSAFSEFKGALTEQYVLQQLISKEKTGIYYYTNERGTCEIDFLLDDGEKVVPVEVKAETNLQAKSLKSFREKYSPEISVRTSMSDYKNEDKLLNLPLYLIDSITDI